MATPYEIEHYEGLVRKTASMYVDRSQEPYEDLCQILRLKIWRALQSYDPTKSKLPVERYVFMCMKNQCKDVVNKRWRQENYIEDLGEGDSFDEQYLAADHDQTFGEIEEDVPLIPSTLTLPERRLVALLYGGWSTTEAARRLGLARKDCTALLASVQGKLADWKPSPNGRAHATEGKLCA